MLLCFLNNLRCGSDQEFHDINLATAPRPLSLPIIGHLHLMANYDIPYKAFSDLKKKYGDIVGLKLGSVESIVVNGHQNIREVLFMKGHHFDGRPNFERYRQLFGGNKENCEYKSHEVISRGQVVSIFCVKLCFISTPLYVNVFNFLCVGYTRF